MTSISHGHQRTQDMRIDSWTIGVVSGKVVFSHGDCRDGALPRAVDLKLVGTPSCCKVNGADTQISLHTPIGLPPFGRSGVNTPA